MKRDYEFVFELMIDGKKEFPFPGMKVTMDIDNKEGADLMVDKAMWNLGNRMKEKMSGFIEKYL